MGWLISSIIFTATFLLSVFGGMGLTSYSALISLIIAVFSFVRYWNIKNSKNENKQNSNEKMFQMLRGFHMAGLPLAERTNCSISFDQNMISINGGGNEFNLLLTKVTDLCIKTEAEIKQQYVSSIGGAVGGAVLFGPLGAIVGGRAKKKESKTYDHFFIITYLKESSEIDYLSFETIEVRKAKNIIKQYKPILNLNTGQVIDL